VARLLGAIPRTGATPSANAASRFVLVGVAATASHLGAALISVDGKPAKPFRVGGAVDEGLVLQSVDDRHAVLGAAAGGPPVVALELQPRKGLGEGHPGELLRPTPPAIISSNLD
jgi:general secretion pathway protein C